MSRLRAASATSGTMKGLTTKAAPASAAVSTMSARTTVPTPTGVLLSLAISPRTSSAHSGTPVVTSMVPTPPSTAARQAWKAAWESSVRMTPATLLGKACSMVSTGLELWAHEDGPGRCSIASDQLQRQAVEVVLARLHLAQVE